MNAVTAFEDRREDIRAQLMAAQGPDARIDAAVFALEQIACVLAQDEQDALCRQRQQAVLALLKRAPAMLRAAQAKGELVVPEADRPAPDKKGRWGLKAVGAAILAVLAAAELFDGNTLFAVLQLAGGAALILGGGQKASAVNAQARGVLDMDGEALLFAIGDMCRAADVCVSDLALLEREAGAARISGTADEATLDLLTAMMEAKASGRPELAARTLDQAQQYLRMLGVDVVNYSEEDAQLFDVLPTMGQTRTIRPAMLRDGKLIRRGVAAKQMEGSVGA